ncbi:MAG: hypothetical protein M3R36_04745 [Bacteroidota bacterium]|nr:hypothetical protein [Bacteroidota bacterium]
MVKHSCISLESPLEWKEALKGIKHSFAHTWENCYAMHRTTGFDTYLYFFERDNIKIICPVAEREYNGYKDIVTPFGFSGFIGNKDFSEFKNYWNEFVQRKNYICGYISLNPAFQNESYFDKKESFQSTSIYFIDLKLSLTELFENLDVNRKRQVKNYKKAEASFIYDRKILTDFFVNNYYNFLKRINASDANYFTLETLEFICSLENVFMVGAGKLDNIEAVYIFSFTDYEGGCMFNVATEEGRRHSPSLLWCGLKFFRSKKIPLMNLGGGIIEGDNVAMSKQRFGAYKLPFINLKQVYDVNVYNKLCAEKNIDANDLNGYFPAYRKA